MGVRSALQRRLTYFPDPAGVPAAATVVPGARDIALHTADGLELSAWFLPARPPVDRRTAVLLAPGNGGNRLSRLPIAQALGDRGFGVLLLDYRGYGGNPGTPSEAGLSQDADAAVDALTGLGYPAGRTLYLGESLGGAVVAALASRRPPAGLLLRSPFTRLADVGVHHYPWLPVRRLLQDPYEVAEHVRRSSVPLVVLYGEEDTVVPAALSARVAGGSTSLVEEVVLPGVDHNDPVMFGPVVADAVLRLCLSLGSA